MQGSTAGDADVLIAGTGAGGATFGYALAKAGRSVLFVERGSLLSDGEVLRGMPPEAVPEFGQADGEERRRQLLRAGRNADTYADGAGGPFVPFTGCGTGGSSSLYGMVLERRFPHDFDGWPFRYEDLAPWYAAAEALYEVRGGADPLRRGEAGSAAPPAPLSEANERLFGQLRNAGLHPYRLHLASRREPGCRLCQGHLCDSRSGCKRDAGVTCLLPALATGNAQLMAGTRLVRLEAGNRRVHTAVVERDGQEMRLTARLFVLAAGALATPEILLRSRLANRSGLVGRRLMRHAIDLYALTMAPRYRHAGESKELGLNDYYGPPGEILGTVQAFGMPPPLAYLRNQPGRNLWRALGPVAHGIHQVFGHAPIVASILADTADMDNRVEAGRIHYRLPAADGGRRRLLRQRVRKAFRRQGAIPVFGTSDRAALGHVCGTVVSGTDGTTSVLTAHNRAHDVDNLYVVDASFFPTSGGVNPALTVMANALRVADHVHREVL